MLEDAFLKEDAKVKKKNLQDKHGMQMTVELKGRVICAILAMLWKREKLKLI